MKLSKDKYLIKVDDYHEFQIIVDMLKQFDMNFSCEELGFHTDGEGSPYYKAIFTKVKDEVSN